MLVYAARHIPQIKETHPILRRSLAIIHSVNKNMAIQPYKLSCALYGHNGDVRSVTATKDGKIVSGSRDMTAKLWAPNESGCGYSECLTFSSHKNFVSCVCALRPSDKFRNGLIVTGSNDKLIRLYDSMESEPIAILNGHTSTVCKIVPGTNEETILSSSWDQTAKLWNLVSCEENAVFLGHKAAVWSAVQLPCGMVATASADKNIKLWVNNGTCLNTLHGHTDCIRDLALCAPKEILSCSNDATVRLWNVETGQCLNVFYGHGHFIYSILHIDSMRFLTSSEDHTVKLWVNGEVVETIQIPAVSVWSVAIMPNGDIVTGSSDGVIRVFSTNASRHASTTELLAYEEQIMNLNKKCSEKMGGIDVSNLPGDEALLVKGTADGQTKVIKVGSQVLAYSWSEAEEKWDLVGHVTGSVDDEEEKPKYKGKAYDYVFSVDIEPGKPLLKLPYNKTDDPWHAAQKFIHDNQLSQHFLEEVANFIIKNSNFEEKDKCEKSEFKDPFTGEARYIPGINSGNDDWRNSNASTAPRNEGLQRDRSPFSSCYFPQREFLKFDQANVNQILEKLLEFNSKVDRVKERLTENEIKSLVKTCEAGAGCTADDIETLDRLLSWPQEFVFPALDVMRLSIRNTEANNYLCNDKLIPRLTSYLSGESGVTSNTMLALRVLANMISGDSGLNLASKSKSIIFKIIENASSHPSKPVQVATSTLLLNMSVMLRRSETADGREEAVSVSRHVLSNLSDQEAVFRALVAIGTLLVDFIGAKNHCPAFEKILVKYQNDDSFGFKVQQCSQHVLQILK